MGLAQYLKSLSHEYPNIAYFYATMGYIFLGLVQIAFKYVCQSASPFQALYMRAFCLFLFNCIVLRNSDQTPYIKDERVFRQMLKRLIFSTTYAALTHYCVKYLPVSTVATLSNTGPIFIFFIEAIYYKKPLNKISLSFSVISFIGVMLVVQPQFIFQKSKIALIENYQWLSFLVIVAALCFSMTMLYIHDLSKKITTIVNLHYSYMGHMILCSILGNFESPIIEFSEIDFTFVIAFILVVIFALITQYMIYAATGLKEPSLTMPLGYLTIVVGFIADVAFFGIKFNLISIIGIILTSVGLLSKLFIREDKSKQKIQEQKIEKKKREYQEVQEKREEQMQKI